MVALDALTWGYGLLEGPRVDREGALYFSEDHRVSAFGAHTWGLKLAKQINADWQADVKFERYGQRAAWRWFGSGSPGLQPFNARSLLVGLSRQF